MLRRIKLKFHFQLKTFNFFLKKEKPRVIFGEFFDVEISFVSLSVDLGLNIVLIVMESFVVMKFN